MTFPYKKTALALLIAGQAGSFVVRRRNPWWSLAGVVLFSIAFWGADYPADFDVFTVFFE